MPEEEVKAELKITPIVARPEDIFRPGVKKIEVVLEPIPEALPDVFLPPFIPFRDFEAPMPVKKSLVLDIETTGINPWDSRIVAIGMFDPARPNEPPLIRVSENEEQLLRDFMAYFVLHGYNEIIGFNIAFDYRFLFAAAMRYRMQIPEYMAAELYDLGQIMKQVKPAYVYGWNKQGTLGQWGVYLFGMEKYASYEDLQKAIANKDWVFVSEYLKRDIELTYNLYALILYTMAIGGIEEAEGSTEAVLTPQSSLPEIQCPNCLQALDYKVEDKKVFCDICKIWVPI